MRQIPVTRDGKESKLTDLKAGDTITVTTDTKDGKAMVTKVEAKAAGMYKTEEDNGSQRWVVAAHRAAAPRKAPAIG